MERKRRSLEVTLKPLGPEPARTHRCERVAVDGPWLVLDGAYHELRAIDWFRVTPLRASLARPDTILRQAFEAANGGSPGATGSGGC